MKTRAKNFHSAKKSQSIIVTFLILATVITGVYVYSRNANSSENGEFNYIPFSDSRIAPDSLIVATINSYHYNPDALAEIRALLDENRHPTIGELDDVILRLSEKEQVNYDGITLDADAQFIEKFIEEE